MKNFKFLFTVSVVSLLILPACQTTVVDIEAEKEAIRDLSLTWTEAVQNKNLDVVMEMLAPDAVFLVDDFPIIEGKEAIREAQISWYADTTIDFSTFQAKPIDIQVSQSGDMAYDRGIESFMQLTPEGKIERRNKWINVWKKIDGQWKTIVMVGNSDNP